MRTLCTIYIKPMNDGRKELILAKLEFKIIQQNRSGMLFSYPCAATVKRIVEKLLECLD